MPGVKVLTGPRSGAGSTLRAPSGTWFVVGVTERGDVAAPVALRGMADYARYLGGRVTYGTLYDQLQTFFAEGGTRAYVQRVVGPAASVGTLTLQDRAVAPAATLRVDAASPGDWSAGLSVAVTDGVDANTFRVTITLNGEVVEDWKNLSDPADAVSAAQRSVYVTLTDLGSASAAPTNNPAVLAATPLSAGADDRAAITDTDRTDALALLVAGLGDGAVSIPGSTSSVIRAAILAHCQATNRVAILADAQGSDAATLESAAAALSGDAYPEFGGLFAPWVRVPDGRGGTTTISPEGFVAACRNRAHEQEGPWRVPAGAIGQARYVVGLDQEFDADTADEMDGERVSVIRTVGNVPTLYGWRSLSPDEVTYYWLKDRDLINRFAVDGKARLEGEVFATIDGRGHLLAVIAEEIKAMVEPVRTAGGIYERYSDDGTLLDPGYSINVGPSVNPVTQLQQQKVAVDLAVRTSPSASTIQFTIAEVGLTDAV